MLSEDARFLSGLFFVCLNYVPFFLFQTTVSYVCMVITFSKGKDQPGKVANPARGQLNREK